MSLQSAELAETLLRLEDVAGEPGRYVVAFSGGLDSTVLLHALAGLCKNDPRFAKRKLVAIHVDHGLQVDSAGWSRHCSDVAAALDVEFCSLTADVARQSDSGLEAAARDARYAVLESQMITTDWLLSAHHRDDQAETLLYNLVRGTGPAGIAGIAEARPFGPGWLLRPLLRIARDDLKRYADDVGLKWIDDPSNEERRFDRNFLRHEVLPQFESRWPDISARLLRSAAHAGEASDLLNELAAMDLATLGGQPARLPIDRLLELSPARQRNVIRHALRVMGLATPTAGMLQRIQTELIPAREDAQPLVSWPGVAVRRYRNGLYLMTDDDGAAAWQGEIDGDEARLGGGLGLLRFDRGAETGLADEFLKAGLSVRFRRGGEEIHPFSQSHTRKLKKLLQEDGVVPWMRDRVPLIYSGERLVAVADLWIANDAASSPGVAVRWIARPALH